MKHYTYSCLYLHIYMWVLCFCCMCVHICTNTDICAGVHACAHMQRFMLCCVSFWLLPSFYIFRNNHSFEPDFFLSVSLAGQLVLEILWLSFEYWYFWYAAKSSKLICIHHTYMAGTEHLGPLPWSSSLHLWKLFYMFLLLVYFVRKNNCVHK